MQTSLETNKKQNINIKISFFSSFSKKLYNLIICFLFLSSVLFSYSPEVLSYFSSLQDKDALEIIRIIQSQIKTEEQLQKYPEKTKELYFLLAEVQEKIGDYEEASKNYEKEASQKGLLAAAKTALLYGDSLRSDMLLSKLTQTQLKESLVSKVRLYAVWSWLVKAKTQEALHEPLVILQSYIGMKGMEEEQSAILLSLWQLTGEEKYKIALEKSYPNSLDFLVLEGSASFLPTPFWFFVPKRKANEDF